jgi:predicted dehydrogenase
MHSRFIVDACIDCRLYEHGIEKRRLGNVMRKTFDNVLESYDHAHAAIGGMPRRLFLQYLGSSVATALVMPQLNAAAAEQDRVTLPPIQASTEAPEKPQATRDPPSERVGYAIVGLGRLALNQILPAFGTTKHSRPVALVSGDHIKALKAAHQYGIRPEFIYNYQNYDRLADNPEVQVIYIALPNSMHADYTIRGARAGKHVLCEKPMAIKVAECQQMIDSCKRANRKLMIAYRSQYEPMDRAMIKMVCEKRFGNITEFISMNAQNVGDPQQWRLKRALSGGGPLPDMGIYSINAARFLSGEEPIEVTGNLYSLPGDPRFKEVEAAAHFILRFQSGLTATCSTSYVTHRSQFLRLQGSVGWAELNPSFAYHGLRLRLSHVVEGHDTIEQPNIESGDQFALEIDHMSRCVQRNIQPHTPGEEGLQDQRIIEAIYESARIGRPVKLSVPSQIRGPDPQEET